MPAAGARHEKKARGSVERMEKKKMTAGRPLKAADRIWFGGDYNPDQWDDATIDQDMKLFREAGINLLTLPVFSWAKLEPDEGVYTFEWLDRIIDKIWQNGIHICLATPTSAQPAWLSARYPEVLPVDIAGRRRTHGMRVMYCVNSAKYRERARAIAEQFAMRYAHHPALVLWHVSNEYGTTCYCPACQAKFRVWLRERYGSLEELNRRWFTSFWGRTLTSFDEVFVPNELNDDYRFNPAVQLDYMRFVTDSTAECFENEAQVLKRYNPEIPVITNMSGYIKKLDQQVMTAHQDAVGFDNYPSPWDPPYFVAMKHDIMRGLKNGQSYLVTEQSPNQQNWQPYNRLKRPGEVRLLAYQGLAHGSDSCLYFQMRQSVAGQEKFHGAVIGRSGKGDTRIFREIAQMGKEFNRLGDRFLRAETHAKAAILFDWNNWWALELASGPSRDMDYLKTVSLYYHAFHRHNIDVDIVSPSADLSGYFLVTIPELYMLRPGIADRLLQFVREGGTLVGTVMTGIADENDRCLFGEYPGPLREAFGIRVEETDALRPEENNVLTCAEGAEIGSGKTYRCGFLCDLLHLEGAKPLAFYGKDFYAGMPAVTEHYYGKGKAYYIGTQPDEEFLSDFYENLFADCGLSPVFSAEEGIEIRERDGEKGRTVFVLNDTEEPRRVDLGSCHWRNLLNDEILTGAQELPGREVLVLASGEKAE